METRGLFVNLSLVIIVFITLPAFMMTEAAAGQVYKWIDRNGVTHYDQQSPEDTSLLSELLHIPDTAVYTAGTPDYASVFELAERLERARLERKRLRIAEEEARSRRHSLGQAKLHSHDESVQYGFVVQPVYLHRHRHNHHRYMSGHISKHHNQHRRKGVRVVKDITTYRGSRGISTR